MPCKREYCRVRNDGDQNDDGHERGISRHERSYSRPEAPVGIFPDCLFLLFLAFLALFLARFPLLLGRRRHLASTVVLRLLRRRAAVFGLLWRGAGVLFCRRLVRLHSLLIHRRASYPDTPRSVTAIRVSPY
jgi:hypothetical protein